MFGIEYLMGHEDDVAYLTPDELCEIKPRICCELVRAHNQLEFFFHALDAFPAFVRSLPFQPPLFFTYWATRWVSTSDQCRTLHAGFLRPVDRHPQRLPQQGRAVRCPLRARRARYDQSLLWVSVGQHGAHTRCSPRLP